MRVLEKINAYGHMNVLCTHKTTIEITKDSFLTKNGNCILGIRATKACIDLCGTLRKHIHNGSRIRVLIISGAISDEFYGYGHKDLVLTNSKDIVFRKSNYICDRTVLINCSKAAKDLKPDLIINLKNPNTEFSIKFLSE